MEAICTSETSQRTSHLIVLGYLTASLDISIAVFATGRYRTEQLTDIPQATGPVRTRDIFLTTFLLTRISWEVTSVFT
jgi:hypothetical protein